MPEVLIQMLPLTILLGFIAALLKGFFTYMSKTIEEKFKAMNHRQDKLEGQVKYLRSRISIIAPVIGQKEKKSVLDSKKKG
jgi:hypothetical protein